MSKKQLFIIKKDVDYNLVNDPTFVLNDGSWNINSNVICLRSGIYRKRVNGTYPALSIAAQQTLTLNVGSYVLSWKNLVPYNGVEATGFVKIRIIDPNGAVIAQNNQPYTPYSSQFGTEKLVFDVTQNGSHRIRVSFLSANGNTTGVCTIGVGYFDLECENQTTYELDVDQDNEVELNFGQEVNEDLTSKTADYSLDFELPRTENNDTLLNSIHALSSNEKFLKNIECYFRFNDALNVKGYLNVEKVKCGTTSWSYNCTFYSSLHYVFDVLRDKLFYDNINPEDDLDFSEYSYNRIHTRNVFDCLYKRLTLSNMDSLPSETETVAGVTFNYSGRPAFGKGKGSAAALVDSAGKWEVTLNDSPAADGNGDYIGEFETTNGTFDYIYASEVIHKIFDKLGINVVSDWLDGNWVPLTDNNNPIPQCDFTNVIVPNAKDSNFLMEKEKNGYWQYYGVDGEGDINATSVSIFDVVNDVYNIQNAFWTYGDWNHYVYPNDPQAFELKDFGNLNGWNLQAGQYVTYDSVTGIYHLNDIIGENYGNSIDLEAKYNNPLKVHAKIKLAFTAQLLVRMRATNRYAYKRIYPNSDDIIGPAVRLRLVANDANFANPVNIYTGQWNFVCNSIDDSNLVEDSDGRKFAKLKNQTNYAAAIRSIMEEFTITEDVSVSIPYLNGVQYENLMWEIDLSWRYGQYTAGQPLDVKDVWGYWTFEDGTQTVDLNDNAGVKFYLEQVNKETSTFSFEVDQAWLANTLFDPTRCLPKEMTQYEWLRNVFTMYNLYMQDIDDYTVRVEPYPKFYSEYINGVQNVDYYNASEIIDRDEMELSRNESFDNSLITYVYDSDDNALVKGYDDVNKDKPFASALFSFGNEEDEQENKIGFTPVITCHLCKTYLNTWQHNISKFVVPHRFSSPNWEQKNNIWTLSVNDKFEPKETLLYTKSIQMLDFDSSGFTPFLKNPFDGSVMTVAYTDKLNYAGMYDDPFDPSTTLEFDSPNWTYPGQASSPWWNLYRIFHKQKMNLVIDNKVLKAYTHLTVKNMMEYKYNNVYLIDNIKWRLVTIEGWNGDGMCECTFIKL